MFATANEFSIFIEKMVIDSPGLNHVDAIIKYCSENNIDEEDIKKLVNKSLTSKLKRDFIDMKYIKGANTTKLS